MTIHQTADRRPDFLSVFLASDKAFRGIGPKRAEALSQAFGSEIIEAILRIDSRVIDIIGEEAALVASAEMELRRPEVSFLEWLDRIDADISSRRAVRLARAWGPQGLKEVRDNPYLLLAIAPWGDVERIARSLGIGPDDPRRDTGAIEAILAGPSGLEAGHTGLGERDLVVAATNLMGRAPASSAVDVAVEQGGAVRNGDLVQPPGAAWMEADITSRFLDMAQQPAANDLAVPRIDPCSVIPLKSDASKLPFPLTKAQDDAVVAAHAHRLFVLAGYAGSGKTSVLRVICDTLEAAGRHPTIVALSGRAAQRASEATGRKATTVAAFLLRRGDTNWQMGASEVLIADEASMLSLPDIWRLLSRLGHASLILCGDPAQLPPIGPGMVFHALCADPGFPRIVLDKVMRQSDQSGIPAVAEHIRHGKIPDLPTDLATDHGVCFIPCRRDDLRDVLDEVGRSLRSHGVCPDDIQIITPKNADVGLINAHFHQRRRDLGATPWPGLTPKFVAGDPVIWRENMTSRGLVNGSLGRILSIDGSDIVAHLDDTEHHLSPADAQLMDLAYAITVHKAQGSQWPAVILPIFPGRLLDRALLYTAITRASRQVILIGDKSAFLRAVTQVPMSQHRTTGLSNWLRLERDLRDQRASAPESI